MYTKAMQHTPYIDLDTKTTLVQVLTQIGNDFIAKSNLAAALPWLQRAEAESSTSYSDRSTAVAAAELPTHGQARLAALRSLLTCLTRLTGLRSPESLKQASHVIATAQAEFGPRRVEVLDMLVMVQAAKGDAGDAVTDLLEVLLP